MDISLPANVKLVFRNSDIIAAIDSLAAKLNQQLLDENPIVLCVMRGGLIFSGQLIPKLNCMLEIDYIHATRYNNQTSGGDLVWKSYPSLSLKNRTVLILDDIFDEGITLNSIVEYCQQQGAEKIISAVLLKKNHSRSVIEPLVQKSLSDNVALTVEDEYVFGFGMDYNGQYRQLDAIYALQGEDV